MDDNILSDGSKEKQRMEMNKKPMLAESMMKDIPTRIR